MRYLLLILVLLFGGVLPLRAQQNPYALPIREHVFDNGLRLLVLDRPGDHRVACKIFTDFGAFVEEPGELGAAHYLEHLMFKGTPTLGTTNWDAERALIEQIRATEHALIAERNQARNALRQRGVFHDYRHADSTPTLDSLTADLTRLDREVARYRDNGAMMRWYQAFGGTRLTATTEQEYMKFDINLPAQNVELFLRVEADRMRNSIFREFDQERMILVEQRYGDLNRPSTPYYEAINATAGIIHPVFWPEGYLSDFYQYTRAYQRDLYERYFVPNNTTLIFIGGVSLEQMVPLVEHYFGSMERAPEPMRVRAMEPMPQAERRVLWRSNELAPRVEARYLIPAVGHPDRPHFDVMAEVATFQLEDALRVAGINGRVNVNTRVVHTSRFGVPGTLNFEVVLTSEEQLAEAEHALLNTLPQMGREAAPARHLALAKKRLRTAWYRTAQNPDQLAFEIGHFQVMDRWQTMAEHLQAREQTTADDLQRLALRYFIPENRTVGIVRSADASTEVKENR